jgi:hypothetical protein
VKVPAGTTLTAKDLMSINWYVAGIDGTVPQ